MNTYPLAQSPFLLLCFPLLFNVMFCRSPDRFLCQLHTLPRRGLEIVLGLRTCLWLHFVFTPICVYLLQLYALLFFPPVDHRCAHPCKPCSDMFSPFSAILLTFDLCVFFLFFIYLNKTILCEASSAKYCT